MRAELLLVPVAVVASIATPAQAETYLTVQQAQKLLFPTATAFTPNFLELSTEQYIQLRDSVDAPIWTDRIKAWRVSGGNWFIVDQVRGRGDTVFYAIGLTADGVVTGIEIMECVSEYDAVRNGAWRKQFVGLRRGQEIPGLIRNISGTSLSSRHIAEGVERSLTTFDLFLRPKR